MKTQFTFINNYFRKIFFISFLFSATISKSQVIVSEGFDNNFTGTVFPNPELPFGWRQGKSGIDVNNYWERVNNANATNPVCTQHTPSGTGMMRYRSFYCNGTNEKAYFVSKRIDLSARPAFTNTNVRFWMWRDNLVAGNDYIQIQYNSVPTDAGASIALPDTSTFLNVINRPCASSPPATICNGWNLYSFIIPGAAAGTYPNTNSLYILITATNSGAGGNNIYIDDFSIDTYPSLQTFNSLSLDFQNVAPVSKNSTNNWIIGMKVNMNNAGNPITPGGFMFQHNGCTNPAVDIAGAGFGGAKLWWTGGASTFSSTNAILCGTYFGVPFPQASFNITPAGITLDNGDNYFWLTYDVPASAISNDYLDADFIYAVIGSTQACGCTLPGGRLIDIAYCIPSYSQGTSGSSGNYTNNDYVKHVICQGGPAFPPGIDNDHNDFGPNVPGSGVGDPCAPPGGCSGGPCPFSAHPPDYQNFPIASVWAMGCTPIPVSGQSNRTAVFLSTSISPPFYGFQVQCGTNPGGNYIAAFIDFNHDGVFNNVMWNLAGGEKIFQSSSMNALAWQSTNFQVPFTGYFGNTTMRVREWTGQPNIDACSPGTFGETEDYTVTLMPACNPPGWDVWLGYTDDWNTNSNWCNGIPTSNTDVLIPQLPAGSFHPVIKNGVTASARKLKMVSDTLEINCPAPGSLTIGDSLIIDANSLMKVTSSNIDSSMFGNGVFTNTTYVPFRQSFREQKMQLMYKTSELLAQGIQDGDIIDSICFPIRNRKSTSAYPVTINMYYATNNATYPHFVDSGFVQPPPTFNTLAPSAPGAPGIPIQVFSGSITMSSQIPVLNSSGTYKIALATPYLFSTNGGANYPLIIEICYTNGITSSNDETWQTQTIGYKSVLLLAHVTNFAPGGCGFNSAPAALNQKLASEYRPNICFMTHRKFSKFPINIKGHWRNDGKFTAGKSIVTFNGTNLQRIQGTHVTTYYDLAINNLLSVKLSQSAKVADSLHLTTGKLNLNSKKITILNPDKGGIVRTNGSILSETAPPNYGTIAWAIGTKTGDHIFPFTTSGSSYIPFSYNLISGDVGTVEAATYFTPVNNIPFPTGVTNVNDTNNANNAAYTADRFWDLKKSGATGTARLKFTYRNSETPAPITNGNLIAQRYNYSTNKWVILSNTMTNTVNVPAPGTSQMQVLGVTGGNLNSTAWVLADASSPLRMSVSAPFEIEVAPNPFTDKIIFSLSEVTENDENISVALYSMLGERVAETIIPASVISNGEQFEWTPANMKAGIYLLVMQTKDEVRTERVVKMPE